MQGVDKMKKSDLQKPIKAVLQAHGFEHVKGNDFAVLASDGKTKLILRIPDGKKGFILGAQFSDMGRFDGVFAHSDMLQYDHAYELAYGSIKECSEDEIKAAAKQVVADYGPYLANGADEIGRRLDEWTFGDLDERERDRILRYFGQAGIDPYSDEYLAKKAEELSSRAGMIVLNGEEYAEHKAFYDRYTEYGAEIIPSDKTGEVYIMFREPRKWYQQ